jgi:hypothetical protein
VVLRASYRDGSVQYIAADSWPDALTQALLETSELEVLRLIAREDDVLTRIKGSAAYA